VDIEELCGKDGELQLLVLAGEGSFTYNYQIGSQTGEGQA
jgi:hypothetical protein